MVSFKSHYLIFGDPYWFKWVYVSTQCCKPSVKQVTAVNYLSKLLWEITLLFIHDFFSCFLLPIIFQCLSNVPNLPLINLTSLFKILHKDKHSSTYVSKSLLGTNEKQNKTKRQQKKLPRHTDYLGWKDEGSVFPGVKQLTLQCTYFSLCWLLEVCFRTETFWDHLNIWVEFIFRIWGYPSITFSFPGFSLLSSSYWILPKISILISEDCVSFYVMRLCPQRRSHKTWEKTPFLVLFSTNSSQFSTCHFSPTVLSLYIVDF